MRSSALHVPLCIGQVVEGFDCDEGTTYKHAAHTEVSPTRKRVLQGKCWIAIPFHRYALCERVYRNARVLPFLVGLY